MLADSLVASNVFFSVNFAIVSINDHACHAKTEKFEQAKGLNKSETDKFRQELNYTVRC